MAIEFKYLMTGFVFGFLIGGFLVGFIIYPRQQSTVLKPTYKWKCTEPYIYQGNYWITCEKYVCFEIKNKNFCKSLGDKLKLELVR